MILPGLIDPHVHMREPGGEHKEDWDSGTSAALAGGFTAVLAMPNTNPPITDKTALEMVSQTALQKARCDYAFFLGAGPGNAIALRDLAGYSVGLKMYLDQTYGPLQLDQMSFWMEHFRLWPKSRPIVAHAEGKTLAAVILFAVLFDRSIHLAHVSRRDEILLIRRAKEKGIKVTCEVAPHHLFLTKEDLGRIGANRGQVRPILASKKDQDALWENLDVIDCFATDHAPHTLTEKDGENPPPGFPGLETALPLFLTAVHEGRLSMEDLIQRFVFNPRRIFNLPEQPDTWIEVDQNAPGEIQATQLYTRCRWTPFEGIKTRGRLLRVMLRGQEVFSEGRVMAPPGFGKLLPINGLQSDQGV